MRVIVFDLVKRRPACVLLQVAYGGSPGIAQMFPAETWLIAPTPDMRAYEIPEAELERVVKALGGLYCPPRGDASGVTAPREHPGDR